MRYQFNLTLIAQEQLADLWLSADSRGRRELVAAMDWIERELRDDPHFKGETVIASSELRTLTTGEITAYFAVVADDRRVDVVRLERRHLDASQNGKPPHGKIL